MSNDVQNTEPVAEFSINDYEVNELQAEALFNLHRAQENLFSALKTVENDARDAMVTMSEGRIPSVGFSGSGIISPQAVMETASHSAKLRMAMDFCNMLGIDERLTLAVYRNQVSVWALRRIENV